MNQQPQQLLTPTAGTYGTYNQTTQQFNNGLGAYHVDPNAGYQKTAEQLTRQQYQDYLNRFQGTEDRIVDLTTSNELLDNQLERNQGIAEKNLNQADISAANAQAKFGLSDLRTGQQKRNLEMNNALSLATANNDTRSAVKDLQIGLMSGASNGRRDSINKIGGIK